MLKKIMSTCSPDNNMLWICIQYNVKKFPECLFLLTAYVQIGEYTLFDASYLSHSVCGSKDVCKQANIVGRKIVAYSGLEPGTFRLQIYHFSNLATPAYM